ncbi:MAG: ABC transporter substrate-binding protein [Sulfuricurvum sp.]|uniref:ABC transporter substrate-binding protein n=1 Tax=Sulfuricurvum sp. TaxID=2025608 RepID=UPI0026090560|nr:ABC transporter substrate-binding protein [Sulfuricurvum sp.]MDD2828679.1 ABC transporter substrate-binding protein [Sulfuricurvum sp.]MDD4949257.1 ABC transporter substrate-binding protein [Sulfuricurvum sp.]
MKKLFLLFIIFTSFLWAQESITLQLPWLHQFQFAGYYVAKEKGYYSDAGLDVSLQDARTKLTAPEAVLSNKAQYGVGRSSLIVDYARGKPFVLMAAPFQSSPMMLLVRADSGIKTAKDLRGKRIMLTDDTIEGIEIQAMMKSVGLNTKDLQLQPHSYNPMSLARKETDAMVAYLSNEPYVLKKAGIETQALYPKDYGFDYYSDFLFTTKDETISHPERAQAFYDASIRGWLWAFEHIEETAAIIYRDYNPQHKSLEALIYEGKVLKKLAFKDNVPFGTIDPVRLDMIAQGYRLMGLIDHLPLFKPLIFKNSNLQLNADEMKWLSEHPIIRVGVDKNWPPMESVDSNGEYFGVSASYLKLLEKRLGVKFEIDFNHPKWSDSLSAVEDKKLDMLACAAITSKRQSKLKFSRSYMKQSIVIVANSDVGYVYHLDDLRGKTIAVVKSYATEEFLKKNYPDIQTVVVNSSLEALQAVKKGKAYACLEGLNVVSYLIERHDLKGLKVVGETPYQYDLAFAFRNDWGMLANITDKVLSTMTPQEYKEIHGQWLVMKHQEPTDYFYVWTSALVLAGIFLLITYKNRQLDELVRRRTDELEEFNQRLQEEIEKAVEKNRTQEKILMQQAKMAEIGSLVESIAHQWRQPLNILGLSMTKLSLGFGFGRSAEIEKTIEIVEQQIQYMSQTIDDFRNFFKQDRVQSQVNISQIIADVETLLGPLLLRKKITLVRTIDPSVSVKVYPNELKQVLINIVNNAREAIEHSKQKERTISISCEDNQKFCTIAIEDSGGGVPLHIIDKIFDPYFTTKFESQGTGIGLYMAKMIVEKHFLGKLSVHNTINGACFEIRINHILS